MVAPRTFAENTHRCGSTLIFLPLVSASYSASTLCASLRLIRATLLNNVPNLEAMQSGGGYKILALLLRQKQKFITPAVLHSCMSMCIDSFLDSVDSAHLDNEHFLLTDWDCMK